MGAGALAGIGLGTSLFGGVTGALGSISAGNAAAAADNYNASIAEQDAKSATQNATWAAQAGEAQAGQESQKTRATVGSIKAAQAANGLDVNSGSAVDVRSSSSELGQLSAINIRSNAARTAYGYQVQSTSDEAQSKLDKFDASQSEIAGEVGAASSLLGGSGSAATNYASFLKTNGTVP